MMLSPREFGTIGIHALRSIGYARIPHTGELPSAKGNSPSPATSSADEVLNGPYALRVWDSDHGGFWGAGHSSPLDHRTTVPLLHVAAGRRTWRPTAHGDQSGQSSDRELRRPDHRPVAGAQRDGLRDRPVHRRAARHGSSAVRAGR